MKTLLGIFGGVYEKNLIDTVKSRRKPHKNPASVFVSKDDSFEIKVAGKFF